MVVSPEELVPEPMPVPMSAVAVTLLPVMWMSVLPLALSPLPMPEPEELEALMVPPLMWISVALVE